MAEIESSGLPQVLKVWLGLSKKCVVGESKKSAVGISRKSVVGGNQEKCGWR